MKCLHVVKDMDIWNQMKSLFYLCLVHSNCPVCGFLKSRIFMLQCIENHSEICDVSYQLSADILCW